MVCSMTAFSRNSLQKEWGTATIELRTLNHRYLEVEFRLPESLRELETAMRSYAFEQLRRGKMECNLKYKPADINTQALSINREIVHQLLYTHTELQQMWQGNVSVSLLDILNWPGVLRPQEVATETLHQDILALFHASLADIVSVRQREGEATAERIEQRLDQVLLEIANVKQRLPLVLLHQREKILARIEEFKLSIEPQRLEEELLLLMQKMDVSEEIERLEIHVAEVRAALKTATAIGRRLDFLMQELHREANTLGSKSSDAVVTHSAIHLKVLIEQMREQVQNIE